MSHLTPAARMSPQARKVPRSFRVSIFGSERAPDDPAQPSSDAIEESAVEANPPQEVLTYFQSVVAGRFPENIPESVELNTLLRAD